MTFTLDPSSTAGACSLSTGTVAFTGAGSCVVDANQAGNASYLAAPQVHQSMTVKVTAAGLIALTLQYAQSSAKYQALTARQKAVVDAVANLAAGVLNRVVPRLTAAQKAALINQYKAEVETLRAGGWLTATQAATLSAAASQL